MGNERDANGIIVTDGKVIKVVDIAPVLFDLVTNAVARHLAGEPPMTEEEITQRLEDSALSFDQTIATDEELLKEGHETTETPKVETKPKK